MTLLPPPSSHRTGREQRLHTMRQCQADLDAVASRHAAVDGRVRAEQEAAWDELSEAVLPTLNDPVLENARAHLHLYALPDAPVDTLIHQERVALTRRSAEGRASPAFQKGLGYAQHARAQAEELSVTGSMLQASLDVLHQDSAWRALQRSGFGTPAGPPWWRLSYYRLRALAQNLVQRHTDHFRVESFDVWRRAREREAEAAVTLAQETRRLEQEAAQVEAVVAQTTAAEQGLLDLHDTVLTRLRAQIRDELRSNSPERLLERCTPFPSLCAAARKAVGTDAKLRYIDGVFQHRIGRMQQHLVARVHDDEVALQDRTFAPHGGSSAEILADAARVQERVKSEIQAYERVARRLMAFQAYHEVDPLAGDLWWDAMTGGECDGSFLDEVAWHRSMQPISPLRGRAVAGRTPHAAHTEAHTRADQAADLLHQAVAALRAPEPLSPAASAAPASADDDRSVE